jgi:superfamily II DNA or RNA helicase
MDRDIKLGHFGYIFNKNKLNEVELNTIRNDLNICPIVIKGYGAKPEKFPVYKETKNHIMLPKYYALNKYGKPDYILKDKYQKISVKFNGKLRNDQINISNEMIDQINTDKRCLLSAFTGIGKTVISLNVIAQLKRKTLIIVHKEFLMEQWRDRIHQFLPKAKIGYIQGDKCDIDGNDIIIGMIQSLSKRNYPKNTFDTIGMTLIDECLPYRECILTENGPIEIGKLYHMWNRKEQLPMVKSFNEKTNHFEFKKITYAFRKINPKLLKIKFGHKKVSCTPNHPFLTSNGYVKACELNVGDLIISHYDTKKEITDNNDELQIDYKFLDYGYSRIQEIKEVANTLKIPYVYDIEVEDNHNFVVCSASSENGVVVHNCHHIGSRVFTQSLLKINKQVMIGLSATPTRKDGLTCVLKWTFGKFICPVSETKRNNVNIRMIEYRPDIIEKRLYSGGGVNIQNLLNQLTAENTRTQTCIQTIKNEYSLGKDILVLSDRVEHIKEIYNQLNDLDYNVGLYIGGMKELDRNESASKKIILATFQMVSEAFDVPRLNTLIMCTPKKDVIQIVGRILRKQHDDFDPLVIDFWDRISVFERWGFQRIRYYKKMGYIFNNNKIKEIKETNNSSEPKLDYCFQDSDSE